MASDDRLAVRPAGRFHALRGRHPGCTHKALAHPLLHDQVEPGYVIDGRYEVVRPLGHGMYGSVFEARQLTTQQSVAIKVLQSLADCDDETAQRLRQRFEREMLFVARLRHPNIVRLIDRGILARGELFTVFEFVDGITLQHVLAVYGRLNTAQAQHLMLQIIDALGAAHAAGIVHRDLKPENIMISCSSARPNAMVLDFGIAGVLEHARGADFQSLTQVGTTLGTLTYMSPEQLCGEPLSPQADIYAWGLVLMECLSGDAAPTHLPPHMLRELHLSDAPLPIPGAIKSPVLRAVIERATHKDLAQRFASAGDVLDALLDYQPAPDEEIGLPGLDRLREGGERSEDPATHSFEGPVQVTARMGGVAQASEMAGPSDAFDSERTVVAPSALLRGQGPFGGYPHQDADELEHTTVGSLLDGDVSDEGPTRIATPGRTAVAQGTSDPFDATSVSTPGGPNPAARLEDPAAREFGGIKDVDDLLLNVANTERLRDATFSPRAVMDLSRQDDSMMSDIRSFQKAARSVEPRSKIPTESAARPATPTRQRSTSSAGARTRPPTAPGSTTAESASANATGRLRTLLLLAAGGVIVAIIVAFALAQ